jgi:hypothetical protein
MKVFKLVLIAIFSFFIAFPATATVPVSKEDTFLG